MIHVEHIGIDELIPFAKNSRTHNDAQVAQIAASIREFGFTNPILIDDKNGIIAGHGRVLAARKLKLDEVPCIRLGHLSEAQKRAYVIADNKIALNSGWDEQMLKLEINDLQALDFDIETLGFTQSELAAINLEVETGDTDAVKEWVGMPDYEGLEPCFRKVVVNFDDEKAVIGFFALLQQSYTEKTKSIWFPEKERRDLESTRWVEDGEE